MKILNIRVTGLPLYNNPVELPFYAVQRVENKHLDMVHNLFGGIYINAAEAFIGINASGKTTALRIVSFAQLLLTGTALNAAVVKNSMYFPPLFQNDGETVFEITFYYDKRIYRLVSSIAKRVGIDGRQEICILSEQLYSKTANVKVNKTNLLDFAGIEPERTRQETSDYLSDDVSIMIAFNKQIAKKTICIDLGIFTDFNLLYMNEGVVPTEIIQLLDPTIEQIASEKTPGGVITRLKFVGQDVKILLNPIEINAYLSSGTIKGIQVFSDAIRVLKNGGYLLIDEIENHFNQELVAVLLRLFLNKRTNPNGAVIVFSTHYPELLDELERNDSVFFTRSDRGLSIDNLNTLLKRNDANKSEIYQSDYLGGTAPKYAAIHALRKQIEGSLEARDAG